MILVQSRSLYVSIFILDYSRADPTYPKVSCSGNDAACVPVKGGMGGTSNRLRAHPAPQNKHDGSPVG